MDSSMIGKLGRTGSFIMARFTLAGLHKTAATLLALILTCGVHAATEIELEPAGNDPDNINSLQRGRAQLHELLLRVSFGKVCALQYAWTRS